MSNPNTHRHNPNSLNLTRRGKIAAGITAVGLTAALLAGARLGNEDFENKSQANAIERTFLQGEKGPNNTKEVPIWSGAVVVNSGANIRSFPQTQNADVEMGNKGNVVRTVEEGQSLVLMNPIKYEDENGDMWLGARQADKEGSLADNMNWINESELRRQQGRDAADGELDNPLVSSYRVSFRDGLSEGRATVEGGDLIVRDWDIYDKDVHGKGGPMPVAEMAEVRTDMLEQFMTEHNFTYSHK